MYTFRRFNKKQIFLWTFRDIVFFTIVSAIPILIYFFFEFDWMVLPTLPLVLLGTAVAFNIGFKNNNAYDRNWEARKIWGGIVNSSRTFTIMTNDFIGNLFAEEKASGEELKVIKKRLIYRHIAWLTALRYQLRAPKEWEHFNHKDIKRIKARQGDHVTEHTIELKDALAPYLEAEELGKILKKVNPATNLIRNQSADIAQLREKKLTDDFRHVEFKNILEELYTLQGKSERIKNYPLPRQYTSISYYFVMLFILIIPFAMIGAFTGDDISTWQVLLAIPASVIVSWVFFTMEKIGDYSENPFEGIGNDVPITSLARTIEIDMRDMIDEENLPLPITGKNGVVI
ncbi:MAG: bestrophin family protein [Crocinitomicaceae bacterium]